MAELIMPRMGDAMDEGRIVQWLKNIGDKVGPDDAVMEIETDKSNVEVTADMSGFIQEFKYQAGDSVPVGTVVAVIGAEPPAANSASNGTGGAAAQAKPEQKSEPAKTAPQTAAPTEEQPSTAVPVDVEPAVTAGGPSGNNGVGPAPVASTPQPAPVAVSSAPTQTAPPGTFKPYDSYIGALPEGLGGSASVLGEPLQFAGDTDGAANERVRVTPLARAMAQANNLDLARVKGTNPDGGISKKDVEAALAGNVSAPAAQATSAPATTEAAKPATAPAAPVATAAEGDEVQEYNAMRRTIARRLSESKSTIPHFYVSTEIDMEALIALREQINAQGGDKQPKVSVNDFLIKACAVALVEVPRINAAFSDNKRILRKAVNIGFGVALEDGLIVPVVKNCEAKSLRAVARETKPLIDKARAGKLAPADYSGGTFTISNMGVFPDIEEFAAIVNPGEGAILAVASTRTVPAVVDGQVVPRKRMKVTLSVDHRVVDGADGAQFLIALKRIIENPLEALA